jgi:hypothetical protein
VLRVTLHTEKLSYFSSAVGHGVNILGQAGMTVTSEGAIMWSPPTHLEVWCNLNLDQWPNDMHTCELELGLWSQMQFVELVLTENGTMVSYFSHYVQQTVTCFNECNSSPPPQILVPFTMSNIIPALGLLMIHDKEIYSLLSMHVFQNLAPLQ